MAACCHSSTCGGDADTGADGRDMAEQIRTIQRYHMVALDLDGTLLNSKHEITPETAAYLRHVQGRGLVISIATGRTISTIYGIIQALHLPRPLPVICSNGAEGYLCTCSSKEIQKQAIFSMSLSRQVMERTHQTAKQLGLVTMMFVGDEVFANPSSQQHVDLLTNYQNVTGCQFSHVNQHSLLNPQDRKPSMLQAFYAPEEKDQVQASFQQVIPHDQATLTHFNFGGMFVEVRPPHVHKGLGLQQLCHHLQISLDDCIAFGDGSNDVEFLQLAGKSFAMKNAPTSIQQVAQEVTTHTNDQNGVMKTLQALEQKGVLMLAKAGSKLEREAIRPP